MKNKGYIQSFGGDVLLATRELEKYEKAWQKGGQVGNLPLAILLGLAVKYTPKPKAKDKS